MRDFPCRRVTHFVTLLPEHKRRADDALQYRPQLETLEPRQLMTADNQDWQNLLSHGGICNCSVCTGQGLNQIAATETVANGGEGTLSLSNPLSSIPLLSSNPGATAKLFLDFNGHTQASWGSYTNVVTPVYDQDGDRTTFSNAELASIQEIWARVAEDYSPFNIDVTTIDPGNSTDRITARIAIGGNYSDWFGQSAGGVAYIGGFYNGAPNVGYVFEDALGNGNARYVAEAASHEAGHLFGLLHQSVWNGNTLVNAYSQGTAALAPIMGVGYYSQRTTWHNGPTNNGPTAYQDDMAILANASNAFGYRADEFGSTLALASALTATNGSVNLAGRIGSNTDEDWFSFTTTGGSLNLTLNVAEVGANLDGVLELRNSSGTLIVSANPTNSLNATLTSTLTAGTYYVVAKSSGGYGNVGQYTLTGTAPINTGGGGGGGGEDTSAPEIDVFNGVVAVLTGGSISFGSVQVGNFADKVITIRNTGTAELTLTPPTAGDMPTGYSIVTNLGSTSLAAGASTTMTVRFTPATTGTIAGTLTLLSNDADEGSFAINLTGTATPAPVPEIEVLNGTTNVASGGSISFGTVQVGNFINRVITIRNSGTGTLTLTPPTAGDMPAGYSIVTNLGSTSLAAGASTTLTVRFTPTVAGTTAGTLTLLSNDADEGSFAINLTGTATPAPAPEIDVLNGTVNVLTGGSVDFGTVQVSKYANKVITVKNTGNAVLKIVKPTATDMPAGFSIVTNFVSTSIAAGASATITIRYTPTTTGPTSGALTILSNDSDEGSFVINLTGTATPGPQPEINVLNGTVNVLTGGSVDFGSVQVTKFANKVITVKNTGTAALTIVKPTAADMPAGFSIVTNFLSTSIAAGMSATITLRYTPTAVGATSGALTILSNDADEGSFVINLSGTATPGPQPEINVLNGTVNVLTGGNIDFGSVQVSKYANKVITIKNTGTAALTIVKPTAAQMPAGFSIVTNFASTSIAAGMSATITLRYTPTTVGATSGALTILSNDADEGSFVINLTGTATPGPQPEINVNIGTLAVASGGNIDFGSVAVGQSINKVITIKNTGTAALTLVKPTAAQMPAGFTIVTNFTVTSLAAGASATITLRFTPTAVGETTGLLNLVSNDADEGTYALNLTGTGTPAPIIRAIDNGAAGFTQTGTWTKYTFMGRENDMQVALKGNGTTTATWTFTDMPAGQYRIHANWTASAIQASNAPFTIYDGESALGTVSVNQRTASSGLTWSGTNWSNLGTFDITGTTIRVTLTNAANERVVADAVRIERIGDLPAGAAAASHDLDHAHLDALPVFVEPTSESSPVTFNVPLAASSFSITYSENSVGSTSETNASLDELFAAAADSRVELLLLDDALDLLRNAEEVLSGSENSVGQSSGEELADENWLLSEDLNSLLR